MDLLTVCGHIKRERNDFLAVCGHIKQERDDFLAVYGHITKTMAIFWPQQVSLQDRLAEHADPAPDKFGLALQEGSCLSVHA